MVNEEEEEEEEEDEEEVQVSRYPRRSSTASLEAGNVCPAQ